ncbi:MAG: hypothetical protein AAGA57_10430 [Planctomycetota bacterium]
MRTATALVAAVLAGPTISAQPAPPPVPEGVAPAVAPHAGGPALVLPGDPPPAEHDFALDPADRRQALDRVRKAETLLTDVEPRGFRDQDPDFQHALVADAAPIAARIYAYFGETDAANQALGRARQALAAMPHEFASIEAEVAPSQLRAVQAAIDGGDFPTEDFDAEFVPDAWTSIAEIRFQAGDHQGAWAALQQAADALPAFQQQLLEEARQDPDNAQWIRDDWGWSAYGLVWCGCDFADPARALALLEGHDLPLDTQAMIHARLAAYYAGVNHPDAARNHLERSLNLVNQNPDEVYLDEDTYRAAIRLGDQDKSAELLARLREEAWDPVAMAYPHAAQAQALAQTGQIDRAKRAATIAVGMAAAAIHDDDYTPVDVAWEAYYAGWEFGAAGLTDHADTLEGAFAFPWAKAYFQLGVARGLTNRAYPEYAPIRQPLGD